MDMCPQQYTPGNPGLGQQPEEWHCPLRAQDGQNEPERDNWGWNSWSPQGNEARVTPATPGWGTAQLGWQRGDRGAAVPRLALQV